MGPTEEKEAREFLRRFDAIYSELLSRALDLEKRGDDEQTLKWTSLAAGFAYLAHPGRFADARLEAIALNIGQHLAPEPSQGSEHVPVNARPGEVSMRRHILHVATCLYEIGGHAALIDNWIRNDTESRHSLILLDQRYHPISPRLARGVAASGGELIVLLSTLPSKEKARELRRISRKGMSCVILHHHPNDVVPILAFGARDCPPVAVMNHADNFFWLGPSIADVVIDFREYGARLSSSRRSARHSMILSIPLDFTPAPFSRAEARRRLNVRDDDVVLLSIGARDKYAVTKTHNFFGTMYKILARNPHARLFVVGVDEDSAVQPKGPERERMHLVGVTSNLSAYKLAADLYLEGFPYGSTTSLYETTINGVCPVLMYAPIVAANKANEAGLKGLIAHAATEEEYIHHVTDLIRDPDRRTRLGREVQEQVAAVHGGKGWQGRLQEIYRSLESIEHRPALVGTSEREETEDDLGLSGFGGARTRPPFLQRIMDNTFDHLTVGDVLRMVLLSLRIGDTRLTPFQIKGWLARLKVRALAPRSLKGPAILGKQDNRPVATTNPNPESARAINTHA